MEAQKERNKKLTEENDQLKIEITTLSEENDENEKALKDELIDEQKKLISNMKNFSNNLTNQCNEPKEQIAKLEEQHSKLKEQIAKPQIGKKNEKNMKKLLCETKNVREKNEVLMQYEIENDTIS